MNCQISQSPEPNIWNNQIKQQPTNNYHHEINHILMRAEYQARQLTRNK
jgi:hypothetical protein